MGKSYMTSWCLALGVLTASTAASAQDAEAGVGLSSDGIDASASGPDTGDDDDDDSWTPQHLLELGVFAGVMFPPKDHPLRDSNWEKPYQDFDDVAFDFGARAALFPWDYVGVEGEYAMMPTKTSGGDSANIYALRAHLIGQIPFRAITPFVVIGGTTLMQDSDELGKDDDRAFHFGIGAKIPVSDSLKIRLDLRDTISDQQEAPDTPHWPEILVGLSLGLGGEEEKAPPPPAPVDTDGDGLTDDVDKCPTEPANTPDGCPILDSDGDGVLDPDDECPQEPGTLPNGCPDLDPDKDGILLPADQCPDVAGIAPDGCPDPDPDKDGFIGDADACPDQPETKNGFEDTDGCPDDMPDKVKKFSGVIQGINFATGKSTIKPESFPILDEAVEVLAEYEALKLLISGHTDSVGRPDKNQKLSDDRAAAVKAYMVGKGIDSSRIETRGAGSNEPIADNDTKEGRAQNRRIEFKILQ